MGQNSKYLALAGAIIAAFFFGRFSAPEKIKTEKIALTQASSTNSKEQDSTQQKIVTQINRKDGTIIYRTRYIKSQEQLQSSTKENSTYTDDKKEVTNRRGVVVSLLVGTPIDLGLLSTVIGVSVQKEILGPINVGTWGIENKGSITAGLSVGMEF